MNRLPTEVLDLASSYVDEPGDLLSFALTNRKLKNVIIPLHLDYRYIRCDLSRRYLWKHLCKNPLLASRIRTLEVINEDSDPVGSDPEEPEEPIIPRTPVGPKDKRLRPPEQYFIPAMRKMTNLRKFRWFIPLVSEEVYEALYKSHPALTGLEVRCGAINVVTMQPLAHLEVWPNFYDLTSFSYTVQLTCPPFFWPNVPNEQREALMILLRENCPNLENLQLDLRDSRGDLEGIYSDIEWPLLRRLNTHAAILHQDHLSFFALHPNLRSLSIFGYLPGFVTPTFDFTALRGLSSLELDTPPQLTLPVAANLTSLSFEIESLDSDSEYRPPGSRPPQISNDHLNIVRACSNLRRLVVKSRTPHCKPLTSLLRVVSQTVERVAYLDLANREIDFSVDGDLFQQPQDLAVLKRLINLTHLGRIHVVDNDYPQNRRAVQSICRVSSAARKLQFLAWGPLLNPERWARIIRKAGGTVTCTKISESKYRNDVDIDGWGGHYRGEKPVVNIPELEENYVFREPEPEDEYSDSQKEESDKDDSSEDSFDYNN